ncbi:MAG: nicotinate phosphoribosyltransferase [Pseudomonadota bacterium]|nr:nicotinate phosphoribosyltransferase [Pseudomonadota bacterium]
MSDALFTDLYELTMLQAYRREGMNQEAVFDLFVRTLPAQRNYLIAAGLDQALAYLENLRFDAAEIEYLRTQQAFDDDFLTYLRDFRFTGDVYAVAEGTPVFAQQPLLEVVAPIAEAQLVETCLMNTVHYQTGVASKGVRVVDAARGRPVVDFGARRAHGKDAALHSARALYLAGYTATSNVAAGQQFGIPIAGTMAHSYVQAHDSELTAFRRFAELYPDTTLLVDTYDTLEGIEQVIRLADELGDAFHVGAVRLDSGDLAELAGEARRRLDRAGLDNVKLFLSGGLDEYTIGKILAARAPADGFGVGTGVSVMSDAPFLDAAYKLVGYGGIDRGKLSPGKITYPGAKQLFRQFRGGVMVQDILARREETHPGIPLLHQVMAGGKRLPAATAALSAARDHCLSQRESLPAWLRELDPTDKPYPAQISEALLTGQRDIAARYGRGG